MINELKLYQFLAATNNHLNMHQRPTMKSYMKYGLHQIDNVGEIFCTFIEF